ncbi:MULTISPECIES: dethiobiotin synthase [unclassified Photobacterium]|uniref:dethiobiotin synthase n=1 Tax=unclassified Photobacterium TaxID=2628852 RepID=UPI000D15B6F9|nr:MULTISPECIES: dethiobiotin synthase [unclassified Photobacterium]PSV29131.1 dethiobiotin synthase [Photobacterium sp. GB-56]PSV33014.1 dethiobiotin synthase [Photobacterium sp. GB-72]PSV36377.1 dethiobiotin synthase [Photobacterium sp. GB-27]PSV41025.1 dethiobiotin synthase [Photobacterium sp. GB-210]PSV54971.1 dethiobiotin synthase [Photobacterium sp. GB-1]
MTNAFFLTGTDTEVGKTVSSRAILQAASQHNIQMAGYKPIASGSEETAEGLRNSDALFIQQASPVELTYQEVNPYTFKDPVSPHLAAEREGKTIDFDVLSQGLAHLKAKSDVVLVEGAGGWRVPVTRTDFLSTWVKQEKLPVILVVGIKLGCLSHAMLTAEAIEADGLELVGWVANRVNPGVENYAEMIKMLELNLPGVKLGEIPYMPGINRRDLSSYIQLEKLGL